MEAVQLDRSPPGRRFRARLERCAERALGRPVAIVSVERTPNRFATLFQTELLALELDSGERLEIFLKHLDPGQQEHPDKRCLEREVHVYEELLCDDGLPVARFYGAEWNEESRRYEVFLEHVADWSLRYHEIACWLAAADGLAQLHAHFGADAQRERLASREYLQRLDERYLRAWAKRALAAAAELASEAAPRIDAVIGRLGPVIELLGAQPKTLVHNDLSPKNVIADRSAAPPRICVVDWEMAGIGCGLIDLVTLGYGLAPADEGNVWRAYASALAGTGLLPESALELHRLRAACEVHKGLHRIAHTPGWGTSPETVVSWIEDLERWHAAV
jgi:hypothetical protein